MGLLGSSNAVSDAMDMLAEASVLVDIMCWAGVDEVLVIDRMCEFRPLRTDAGTHSISTSVKLASC